MIFNLWEGLSLGCLKARSLGDKIRGPPFYTKNGHFHPVKSQPVALQKNVKIPQGL